MNSFSPSRRFDDLAAIHGCWRFKKHLKTIEDYPFYPSIPVRMPSMLQVMLQSASWDRLLCSDCSDYTGRTRDLRESICAPGRWVLVKALLLPGFHQCLTSMASYGSKHEMKNQCVPRLSSVYTQLSFQCRKSEICVR